MAMLLGTWELGFGYGHIAHLAPLAQALKARGHRMTVASRNRATAQAAAGDPFADVLSAPLYRAPPREPVPTLTYAQVIADGGMNDLPAAIELVRAWLAIFDRVKPEAILAEHAPVSVLAAHVARLPSAMIGPAFMVPPAERPLPSLLPWTKATEADRAAADDAADAVVREVCRRFGAPRLDGLAALLGETHPYLTTWPELDIHGPRPGATYYGPIGGFPASARPAWPDGPGPRLFVYIPFDHPRCGELLDALWALGWPAIWYSVGAPAATLPPNVRVSDAVVDLPHILGQATAVVSRGAHGTTCQAIAAGCPSLTFPDTLETGLLARRLTAVRLGLIAGPGADGVRAALERLVSDRAIADAVAAARTRYGPYRPALAAGQLADAIIEQFAL